MGCVYSRALGDDQPTHAAAASVSPTLQETAKTAPPASSTSKPMLIASALATKTAPVVGPRGPPPVGLTRASTTWVPEDEAMGPKTRRAAVGHEAVHDQIRKIALDGNRSQSSAKSRQEQETDLWMSESDDDEALPANALGDSFGQDDGRMPMADPTPKPNGVAEKICEALTRNFVFRGIAPDLLRLVVDRMVGQSFRPGSVVLQQGARPQPDDCMYYLSEGEVDVAICGAMGGTISEGELVGRSVRIPQKPGWVFGDVALLFNSSRTASVIARTNVTVWALERATFLEFVMKHAQGARALRFLRKLPLLKGLSDNDLIRTAVRMPQRLYENGESLITYGESGDELYLIRYGKVRVMRPDGNGGRVTAVVLWRGQFVGERAVINNRLRSADCVAQGRVQVVVMRRRDFMDLDNPLLAWMMDYDAVSTCLRYVPVLKGLPPDQVESVLDCFHARQELFCGTEIVRAGDVMDQLVVVKQGEVRLTTPDGTEVPPSESGGFVQEHGGFCFFGSDSLSTPHPSPYTVTVHSDVLHLLSLPGRALVNLGIIGKPQRAVKAAPAAAVSFAADGAAAGAGDASSGGGSTGESAMLGLAKPLKVPPTSELKPDPASATTAARTSGLETPSTPTAAPTVRAVHAPPHRTISQGRAWALGGVERIHSGVAFSDLEPHRIIGTGQFGSVRLVRDRSTGKVYALKIMHKAPIVERKQIEHVLNEQRILQQAAHPNCVQMVGAFQDEKALYMLMEWVPGGELFHHLDVAGAFGEAAAVFFAANVVLSLEFLHAKGIVHRDLKPENLLLDADGYLKLTDYGFAKYVGVDKTYTICGTPDYQAPEAIMRRGTTKAADYWALGVLIFEMLVGDPPFKSATGDPWDTFRRTLSGRFYIPQFVSDTAADIIFKLLQVDPERRMGTGPNGAAVIKAHAFFANLDWAALEARTIEAPVKIAITSQLDTSNFDNFDTAECEPPPVPADVAAKQPKWEAWDWV
ncbi:hypothetical protein FOA52_002070 [Chlamydomonas sp. UWO 241]|nr:hypothetical protein FOA52_002070 [Chlamydomonas sp. UWO 241]